METVGKAKQRQKLELREFQNESKALVKKWKKENLSKKEIDAKLIEMEEIINARHATELEAINSNSQEMEKNELVQDTIDRIEDQGKRNTKQEKAIRKRDKKKQEERERKERIEFETKNVVSEREIECDQIRLKLQVLNMTIKEISSDGHCMYHAIADQLSSMNLLPVPTLESHFYLRKRTADQLRLNKENFLPFVEINYESDISLDEQYELYCRRVEHSSDWGGQIELRALAQALQLPIQVYAARSDVIVMGEEFQCDGVVPLRVSYHLHYYALGEHYNSIAPIPKEES